MIGVPGEMCISVREKADSAEKSRTSIATAEAAEKSQTGIEKADAAEKSQTDIEKADEADKYKKAIEKDDTKEKDKKTINPFLLFMFENFTGFFLALGSWRRLSAEHLARLFCSKT
mgnify:CR=1 FL=1